MTRGLEFYFDLSSPWTYFAFVRIQSLAERCDAEIIWKPILVGGVFNAVNPEIYAARDALFSGANQRRTAYYAKDLQDWATFCGMPVRIPDFHPSNSVKAMRGCFVAADQGCLSEYSARVFEAYFGSNLDISDPEVLEPIVRDLQLQDFFTKIALQEYKDRLRANTDELIARGGFGSPTIFVEDRMFFGNDRLPLVEYFLLQEDRAENGRDD